MKCVFDRTTFCTALSEKHCAGCSFKKTPEELDAGRDKADDRVSQLPEEQQDHIRRKYGPWRIGSSKWRDDGNGLIEAN